MKYLLLLALVGVALWLWSAARRRRGAPDRPTDPKAVEMVRCAHCGVHLPRTESLPGQGGQFCDAGHRAAFEKSPHG
ncbi:MAG: PP0621 family protein [Pseudomonadota bacterium]